VGSLLCATSFHGPCPTHGLRPPCRFLGNACGDELEPFQKVSDVTVRHGEMSKTTDVLSNESKSVERENESRVGRVLC